MCALMTLENKPAYGWVTSVPSTVSSDALNCRPSSCCWLGEHHVDRWRGLFVLGSCGATSPELSCSRIELVRCNGALHCLGVHVASVLSHLIHIYCYRPVCCGSSAAQPSKLWNKRWWLKEKLAVPVKTLFWAFGQDGAHVMRFVCFKWARHKTNGRWLSHYICFIIETLSRTLLSTLSVFIFGLTITRIGLFFKSSAGPPACIQHLQ